MLIKSIALQNVTVHNSRDLALPPTGIVVLSGPNGGGKSTFIEAVPAAIWNTTLRGTPLWQEGKDCSIAIETDKGTVTRSVKGSKKGVVWSEAAADTSQKLNEKLAQAFGDMDVWRRTHVFSSADAAHFTQATDAQRKRLIEQMLGLDKFDAAHEACRADLKAAKAEQQKASELLVQKQRLADAYEQALASLRPPAPVQHSPEPAIPTVDHEGFAVARAALDDAINATDIPVPATEIAAEEAAARTVARLEGETSALLRQIRGLQTASSCPTCKTVLKGPQATDHLEVELQGVQQKLAQARTEYQAAATVAEQARAAIRQQAAAKAALVEERRGLVSQHDRAVALEQQAKAQHKLWAAHVQSAQQVWERELAQFQERKARANQQVLDSLDEVDSAIIALRIAEQQVRVLEICDKVLGTKGVRSVILTNALQAAEARANQVLAEMSSQIRVQIRPFTELKGGGVSADLSIEVFGAGGGLGYKAASGGERRRIDAALLLAFADIAEASAGVTGGTVFVDEVFDAIDESGCPGVVSVLQAVARRRCVVVITHQQALAEQLKSAGAKVVRL